MVVTHVRTRHVLVLNTGDTLTKLLALYPRDVTQHTGFAEVLLSQVVG